MKGMSEGEIAARIPCTVETRDEVLKPMKRADETYDDLLRKMAEQYDPEAAQSEPPLVNP